MVDIVELASDRRKKYNMANVLCNLANEYFKTDKFTCTLDFEQGLLTIYKQGIVNKVVAIMPQDTKGLIHLLQNWSLVLEEALYD